MRGLHINLDVVKSSSRQNWAWNMISVVQTAVSKGESRSSA